MTKSQDRQFDSGLGQWEKVFTALFFLIFLLLKLVDAVGFNLSDLSLSVVTFAAHVTYPVYHVSLLKPSQLEWNI